MPVQPPLKNYRAYRTQLIHRGTSMQALPAKKKRKNIAHQLFNQINPFQWFNDFRNIEITLEEFGKQRTGKL